MPPITFSVVDLTCEQAEQSAQTPQVKLTTVSQSTIRTRHGWSGYNGDLSVLYKTLTPSGSHLQTFATSPLVKVFTAGGLPLNFGDQYGGGAFAGGLLNTYSGFSQIDIYGNVIQHHQKIVSVPCLNQPYPDFNISVVAPQGPVTTFANILRYIGYCWQFDPTSCPSCNSNPATWSTLGDFATNNPFDAPYESIYDAAFLTNTPTTLSYNNGIANEFYSFMVGATNFPTGQVDFFLPADVQAWARAHSTGNWSFTLSDPYTNTDAINSQVVYSGVGSVTENSPNYSAFATNYIWHIASRITVVNWTLHCTNLIVGKNYMATFETWNLNTNIHTTILNPFTATAATQDLTGTLAVPPAGQRVKMSNATIRYN